MPLFIRDATVNAHASELQRTLNAPSKTAAVRQALANELARTRQKIPLRQRIAKSQAMATAIGEVDPDFDIKAFSDETWITVPVAPPSALPGISPSRGEIG